MRLTERELGTLRRVAANRSLSERLVKLQEEMGESIAAISRTNTHEYLGLHELMVHEVADVLIVLESILQKWPAFRASLDAAVVENLKTLDIRLGNGHEE